MIDGKRQDHKMKTKGLTTQRLEVREDGKTNTLTTVQKDNVIVKQQHWRRLSPKECERLMTVEDDATLYGIDEDGKEIKISNTQRYKMLQWLGDRDHRTLFKIFRRENIMEKITEESKKFW